MKKFIVVCYYSNIFEDREDALVPIGREYFDNRIREYDDPNNTYENGEVLWDGGLFDGEVCEIYDTLELAFKNSHLDKTEWNKINISRLSEENKALAQKIIAAA